MAEENPICSLLLSATESKENNVKALGETSNTSMTNSSWCLQHSFCTGSIMSKNRKTIGSSADTSVDGWNSKWNRPKFLQCAYHRWEDKSFRPFQSRSDLTSADHLSEEPDLCCNTHDHAKCHIQTIAVLIWLICMRWSPSWNYKKGKWGISRRRETNTVVVTHLFSSPLNKILLSWRISLLPTPEHTCH
jgi:hypothetical protein